ncbi:MAG TPA: glycosyltransferase family 39 protein [Candidatus Saccharimonadales bacterium]|nr:glycosyltransferase family 39 protein [Candidatus Saccharimonadales bacterium]
MGRDIQQSGFVRFLRHYWLGWVLATATASFGLTLWIGLQQSVWFDEAYSISLIKQSYSQLVSLTAVDVHPPLYYILLKLWSGIFGTGEIALRSFSALCSAAAVGVGLVMLRRLFGLRAMVFATPLLILAPFLVRYGFEIRMYALASLIGVGATYVLVRATQQAGQQKTRWWILYSVLVAAGMYTLYYLAFVWIAHVVWLLYRLFAKDTPSNLSVKPLLAYIGSVVLYLPWLPSFLEQFRSPALSGIAQRVGWEQLTTIFSFTFIYMPQWALNKWGYALIFVIIVGMVALVVRALQVGGQARPYIWLLVFYFTVPIIIMILGSLPPLRPLFVERYISHFDIAGFLLIAACIGVVFRNKRTYAVLFTVLLTGVLLYGVCNLQKAGNYNFQTLSRPQTRQAVEAMGRQCQPDSVIIAGSPLIYFELIYYLPNCDVRFYSSHPIGPGGGYATIYQSPKQYYNDEPLQVSTIYMVYSGQKPSLSPTFLKTSEQSFKEYRLAIFKQQ